MCQKLPYCARRIDPCIQWQIALIYLLDLTPLLSCCGHAKYPPSVVVLNPITQEVYEFLSGVHLSHGIRSPYRYYKRDKEGYYYLPECINAPH